MSISTNKFLNNVVIWGGQISNGKITDACIKLLYVFYRWFPPKHVREALQYYNDHKYEVKEVLSLLEDDESKEIYKAMIKFRSTYDMRVHPNWSDQNTYFVDGVISLTDQEVFVDCGAFDGDTVDAFLRHTDSFERIIAFEPDTDNFNNMQKKNYGEKVYLINAGVWNCKTTLYFAQEGSETSKVLAGSANGNVTIPVECLDDMEICKDATYIKMDIEGSEFAALQGAQGIISERHPKLAISIYHKVEDMTELPLFIHRLYPKYKMYVRQHSHSFYDTVLYCIPEE